MVPADRDSLPHVQAAVPEECGLVTTVEVPTFLYWIYVGMGYAFWLYLLVMIGKYMRDFFVRRRTRVYTVRVSLMNSAETGYRFRNELEDGHVILADTVTEAKEKVELYIMDRDNLPRRFIQLHLTDENGN